LQREKFTPAPLSTPRLKLGSGRGAEVELKLFATVTPCQSREAVMGFGRGALLWLLGVPLPIIILLALFMHH
jgi:hypothetical protein